MRERDIIIGTFWHLMCVLLAYYLLYFIPYEGFFSLVWQSDDFLTRRPRRHLPLDQIRTGSVKTVDLGRNCTTML